MAQKALIPAIAGLLLSATLPQAASAQGAADTDAQLLKQANTLFAPIPTEVPEVKGNPVTPEKVELGQMLFYDPRLSASQIIACSTCHNLAMGGDDNVETSIGHGWQAGPRNSPTVYNSVFNVAQFWDGRAADLKEQAKGPIEASVEMNNRPDRVVQTLKSIPEYVERFEAAFPDADDAVSFDNMARAIEAFEATLITPNAPFDRFLAGDTSALNEKEKRGLKTFIDSGCVACHSGQNIGGQAYYPFGVVERPGSDILPSGDKGRFQVTETASDEYVFRAVPLRNVALTAPYFHSGKVWDLHQAVAIMGTSQLGRDLSDEQIDDIVAFLHTLTGEMPEVTVPHLPPSTQDTPRPLIEVNAQPPQTRLD